MLNMEQAKLNTVKYIIYYCRHSNLFPQANNTFENKRRIRASWMLIHQCLHVRVFDTATTVVSSQSFRIFCSATGPLGNQIHVKEEGRAWLLCYIYVEHRRGP